MKGIDRLTPLASRYVDVDSRRHSGDPIDKV
jgi:hypothetical protein